MKLTKSMQWLIAAFAFSAASLFITFFLEGDVRTFGYVVIGMIFALFAIYQGQPQEKPKKAE